MAAADSMRIARSASGFGGFRDGVRSDGGIEIMETWG
jgi:hypothetical protein